jgi:hypothetical protein
MRVKYSIKDMYLLSKKHLEIREWQNLYLCREIMVLGIMSKGEGEYE